MVIGSQKEEERNEFPQSGSGYRLLGHKCNEDIKEELGITD
jgi:hypothetical protein